MFLYYSPTQIIGYKDDINLPRNFPYTSNRDIFLGDKKGVAIPPITADLFKSGRKGDCFLINDLEKDGEGGG